MSTQTFGTEPTFRMKSRGAMSPEEAAATYGDPALNVHPAEFNNLNLDLVSRLGEPYSVHLGLPNPIIGAYGALKQFEPSHKPHVFTADRFVLKSAEDPNRYLVEEDELRVLHMHARRTENGWVPSDAELEAKGVTIPDLVSSFEQATGWPIDVIWACQMSADRTVNPFNPDTGHPYIYPISGFAQGHVRLERGELTVALEEAPDEHSLVEYQDWLTARVGSTAVQ